MYSIQKKKKQMYTCIYIGTIWSLSNRVYISPRQQRRSVWRSHPSGDGDGNRDGRIDLFSVFYHVERNALAYAHLLTRENHFSRVPRYT